MGEAISETVVRIVASVGSGRGVCGGGVPSGCGGSADWHGGEGPPGAKRGRVAGPARPCENPTLGASCLCNEHHHHWQTISDTATVYASRSEGGFGGGTRSD